MFNDAVSHKTYQTGHKSNFTSKESKAVITFREEVIDNKQLNFSKLDKNMEIQKTSGKSIKNRPVSSRITNREGLFTNERMNTNPLYRSGMSSIR